MEMIIIHIIIIIQRKVIMMAKYNFWDYSLIFFTFFFLAYNNI